MPFIVRTRSGMAAEQIGQGLSRGILAYMQGAKVASDITTSREKLALAKAANLRAEAADRRADEREEWEVTVQGNSADAFEKLRLSIRRHGLHGRLDAVETLDPLIMEAAVRIGWQRLCEMSEFNRDSLFRLFDAALKAVAREQE